LRPIGLFSQDLPGFVLNSHPPLFACPYPLIFPDSTVISSFSSLPSHPLLIATAPFASPPFFYSRLWVPRSTTSFPVLSQVFMFTLDPPHPDFLLTLSSLDSSLMEPILPRSRSPGPGKVVPFLYSSRGGGATSKLFFLLASTTLFPVGKAVPVQKPVFPPVKPPSQAPLYPLYSPLVSLPPTLNMSFSPFLKAPPRVLISDSFCFLPPNPNTVNSIPRGNW